MPTGRKYSTRTGRWERIEKEQAFDYLNTNLQAGAYIVSFFRFMPDRFLDILESPTADFTLALPQRLMIRAMAHNRTTMIVSSRGLGKTYIKLLAKMADGVLYPGEIIRDYAPSLKQAAELASVAFHQIERNYPLLAQCWKVKSETKDTFHITTDYGSSISIGATQGGNCSQMTAEEIGQEVEPKFDFTDYESKANAVCRLNRMINKELDRTHINQKMAYVTNASRRVNRTYYKYRAETYKAMAEKPIGEAFIIEMGWEIPYLFGIRDENYTERLKATMTREDFLRQMCACFTGSSNNPMVSDEDLSQSRRLLLMESKHCGDPNVVYVIGHDVSYEEGTKNAKCADIVLKLIPQFDNQGFICKDKYQKEVVWVDTYPPPKDHAQAAARIKNLWLRFCLKGGQATWIAIDAWQYGNAVMKELIKPSGDGINLCCYHHLEARELEGDNPLEVIYPVKAGGAGVRDPDADMIRYMRIEFEQGNIKLLTPDVLDGLDQYKKHYGIKDNTGDSRILLPYNQTNILVEQIQNLEIVASGISDKEKRVSSAIQRDLWSALKYAGRVAYILESDLAKSRTRKENSWQSAINNYHALPTRARKATARDRIISRRGM